MYSITVLETSEVFQGFASVAAAKAFVAEFIVPKGYIYQISAA